MKLKFKDQDFQTAAVEAVASLFAAGIIPGALKVAIQAVVIAAAVLMFVALIGWVGYEKIRNRIGRRDSDG